MALFIILMIFLVYLFLKYATLAILFALDFIIIGLASYSLLYEKFGHDSSLFIVGIILILYAILLVFISRKIRILNIIINYLASLFSAYLGIEIFLPIITEILKSMGILENTYSKLVVTHVEYIDNIINFIFLIIVSIAIYKIRINFIDEKFNLNYYTEKKYLDDLNNNHNTDKNYIQSQNEDYEEDYEFYQEYMQNKNRYLDNNSEEENNKYNEIEYENEIEEENYYIRKHIENTKLGELGEEFVYNIEKNNVAVFNKDYVDKVERVSKKTYGDKLGYDISSIDINGNDLKIEVKTTTGDCDKAFYISENELRFLKEHKNNGAILYRVYNFNEETKTGEIKKITADEILNNYKVDTKNYTVQKREKEINSNCENKIIPTVLKYSEDVVVVYYDENIWMRKFMISKLFNVDKNKSDAILNNLLSDKILDKDKNIKKFYIESENGKNYNVEHFDLNSVFKIGEEINSEEIINLKKWIEEISHKYKIKNLDKE